MIKAHTRKVKETASKQLGGMFHRKGVSSIEEYHAKNIQPMYDDFKYHDDKTDYTSISAEKSHMNKYHEKKQKEHSKKISAYLKKHNLHKKASQATRDAISKHIKGAPEGWL